MTCTSKLYQSIVNSCTPKKGIESTAYWAYLSDLQMGFSDNSITSIDTVPLGVISAAKFALNAGHDLVIIEDQPDRFTHKFTAVINENSVVVDKLDDIVLFVKENGSTTWTVYGAKYGLWKTSQAQMINDNRAAIAVEFASREGMEEEYEKYNTSVDVAALPNMNDFDLIYGGTIANGGAVKLSIDAGKTAYIKLPNGIVLSGDVIDTTYSGVSGSITYYVPKDSAIVELIASGLTGAITYNGTSNLAISESGVTSIVANETDYLDLNGSANLATLIAGEAVTCTAVGCALTAKSIGDILYSAYIDNRENVVYDFSGGTNAYFGLIDSYLNDTYTLELSAVVTSLEGLGGVITIEP